jgi:20S proteasome subunit alpha 3
MEQLVKEMCNYKQQYTQFGGLRPFGVAFVFAGWDKHHGFQLYQSDPSGNYSGWRATVIGQNSQAGKGILKTDYKENSTQADNLKLAVKIMLKTMDATAPSPERIDLSEVKRMEDGSLVHVTVSDDIVQNLIDVCQREAEAESKTSGDI